MRFDTYHRFENDRDLNGIGTGTTVSTDKWDSEVSRDLSPGTPIWCDLVLSETVTSGGAATVNFVAVAASDAGLTANLKQLNQTGALALADLVVGNCWSLPFSVLPNSAGRYYGILIIVAVAALTAGELTAFLANMALPTKVQYPSGYSVSV